jgi:hypothetical protein
MPAVLRTIASGWGDGPSARRAALLSRALAVVALLVCAPALVGLFALEASLSTALTFASASAIALVASAAVASFDELGDLSEQRARDLDAQSIYDQIRRGETPQPYAVYLRPFSSTGQIESLALSALASGIGGSALGFSVTRFELEQQVERAARGVGPLVCLGKGLEHVGAGRLEVSDDDWRAAVLALITHAKLIVMLPSSRPGTLWEIEHVLESGAVERTVFIDPPNTVLTDKRLYDQAKEWNAVRDAFAKRGYQMPDDSRIGRLLFFGASRTPQMQALLDIDAEDNIAKFFKAVLKAQGQGNRT